MSLKNRIIGLAAVSAAALAVAAPLASAKTTSASLATAKIASPCDALAYTQAFLPFGDSSQYFLAPQGSFEGAYDGWTVTGSAKLVADAAYPTGPAADTTSLELSAGSTALSPPLCANATTPSFRLFLKALSANPRYYSVGVSYPSATGGTLVGAEDQRSSTSWTLSSPIGFKTNKISVDASGWGYVRISVTAPSNSAMRIDDLYIDPRMH